jgi:S1-C subfamily serine protease
MSRIGITQIDRDKKRNLILGKLSAISMIFLAACVLPFLIYAYFWWFPPTIGGNELKAPVCKIVLSDATGTGFLVSPTQVLTALHVVENLSIGDKVDLIFEKAENKSASGTLQFKANAMTSTETDPTKKALAYFTKDFALIEIPAITDISPLSLGSSSNVTDLQKVIVIGYPEGDMSVTSGNINSLDYQGFDLFKHDVAVNPGNSGGPLISVDDNSVVGIVVARSPSFYKFAQGENIALKIDDVIKELKNSNINIQ